MYVVVSLIVAALVSAPTPSVPVGETAAAEGGATNVATVVLPTFPCDYKCKNCGTPGEHELSQGIHNPDHGMETHSCWTQGSCATHVCPVSEAMGTPYWDPSFWAALAVADAGEVQLFLRNNSHVAYLNEDRQSLQIRGCREEIFANLPLSDAAFAFLTNN